MANTIRGFEKPVHSPLTETETLKDKSLYATKKTSEDEGAKKKELPEDDSIKLQFFHELKQHLMTLNHTVDSATLRNAVSEDFSISRQLSLNPITNLLSSMDSVKLTDEEQDILEKNGQEFEKILFTATQDSISEASTAPSSPEKSTKGDNVICEKLAELLHKADKEYLQAFEYASKIRAEFQEKIAAIQQEVSKHISKDTSKDKEKEGNIKIDAKDIDKYITDKIDSSVFSEKAMASRVLYPPNYSTPGTPPIPMTPEGEAEAKHWASVLPGSEVIPVFEIKDGRPTGKIIGYAVGINMDCIEKLRDSFKLTSGTAENGISISATKFQTWQTGFNSEIESIKTTTQELAQSYNNANSTFSTLSKLLSASIHTMFDSLATYLRF